ncbi:MAG: hypothetical protein PHH14_04770 [Candidatus Margulisbacteria bacterium]|nr:hypothetical protein [Candidatus Margulisiibacteriota bacterium]
MSKKIITSEIFPNRIGPFFSGGHFNKTTHVISVKPLDNPQEIASTISLTRKALKNPLAKDGEQIDVFFFVPVQNLPPHLRDPLLKTKGFKKIFDLVVFCNGLYGYLGGQTPQTPEEKLSTSFKAIPGFPLLAPGQNKNIPASGGPHFKSEEVNAFLGPYIRGISSQMLFLNTDFDNYPETARLIIQYLNSTDKKSPARLPSELFN